MTPQELQLLFGKETAKIYFFDGTVPEGEDVSSYVTHEFAKEAGTNLINCIVTTVQESILVYTHTDYVIPEGEFRFYVDLPIPEPEIVPETLPTEPEGGQ